MYQHQAQCGVQVPPVAGCHPGCKIRDGVSPTRTWSQDVVDAARDGGSDSRGRVLTTLPHPHTDCCMTWDVVRRSRRRPAIVPRALQTGNSALQVSAKTLALSWERIARNLTQVEALARHPDSGCDSTTSNDNVRLTLRIIASPISLMGTSVGNGWRESRLQLLLAPCGGRGVCGLSCALQTQQRWSM